VDRLSTVVQRVTIGDLTPYGLPPPPRGIKTRATEGAIPILDIGLIDLLKQRRVEMVAAVDGFEGRDVVLADDTRLQPDAVIAATGFRRGLEPLVGRFGVLGSNGQPVVHGGGTHPNAPRMYFTGYTNPLSGNLREVGIDAKRIAKAVVASRSKGA
jgi:putative flavoprotein involved in K+ transport